MAMSKASPSSPTARRPPPTLLWPSEQEPAPAPAPERAVPPATGIKRKLHLALEQLEREVEQGHVNEGAHVRLSKCLKDAFNARDDGGKQQLEAYLVEQLVHDPWCMSAIPFDYREIVEDKHFLRRLIRARCAKYGRPIKQDWWDCLMEGYLADWMVGTEADEDPGALWDVRFNVIVMLQVRGGNALKQVERRLDALKVRPEELFPADLPPDHTQPDVWCALRVEPRFLRWLLNPGGVPSHGYSTSKMEVRDLQEFAFDHGDSKSGLDAGYLKALGLRNKHEFMSCSLSRALGKSFEEGRTMAQ